MPEEMEFCIECGESLPDTAAFCPSCGLNIDRARESNAGGGSARAAEPARGGTADAATGATAGGTADRTKEPNAGRAPAGGGTARSEAAYDDAGESLVEEGEQISTVALLFMGVAGGLFVLAAFIPTWYMKCVEMEQFGYGCASHAPADVPAEWRAWVAFWGGFVLLSLADEYANLGVFGSWRIKKSKVLLIAGIFGMAPTSALEPVNGELQLGAVVILAAGSLMLLYAVPAIVWQWLFDKRIGSR
ncbi:zinc ribbon domain-containing protein [Halostella salina]|uniref:zinc ribbon domain-containing protein n=1 Tax=Halostella salina TaxID=1547897 RepID=UPI000EF7EE4E|nr:zinc ribbon domain-containing protein [Halostella salina]